MSSVAASERERILPNPKADNEVVQPVKEQENEIEGVRARQLRRVFTTALDKSIKNCSYENFSKCFPTPAKNAPEVLRDTWTQMCRYLETSAQREYGVILKERNVISSLNQLDLLIKEASDRKKKAPAGEKPISPSTLPPDIILTAQLTPLLIAAQQQVTSQISAVRSENTGLMSTIEDQRREIEQLLKVLENNLGHLEGAVEVIKEGRKLAMKDAELMEKD